MTEALAIDAPARPKRGVLPAPWMRPAASLAGFTLAHVAGLLVVGRVLVTLPILATVATYFVLLFWAAVSGQGVGGPLFLPLAVVALASLGLAATAAISGVGIVTDLLRRALRWPIWTPPLAVLVAAAIASSAWRLAVSASVPQALLQAALLAALAAALFCLHWVPVATVALAWRLFRDCAGWAGRKLRERRDRPRPTRAASTG